MCGRYTISKTRLENAKTVLDTDLGEVSTSYNIAPSQNQPVIRQDPEAYQLAVMRWGLVPHWSKEPQTMYSTINARVEKVARSPAYRDAYRYRRGLGAGHGLVRVAQGRIGYIH